MAVATRVPFDENKHPRGRHGQFIDVVGRMTAMGGTWDEDSRTWSVPEDQETVLGQLLVDLGLVEGNPANTPTSNNLTEAQDVRDASSVSTVDASKIGPASWESDVLSGGIPQDREEAAVFRRGVLVATATGASHDVDIDSAPGDVVTHTHPDIPEISTIALSDSDVRTAALRELNEIRAINRWGVAVLRMSDGSDLDYRKVKDWNDEAKVAGIDHRSDIDGTRKDLLERQEEVRLASQGEYGLRYEIQPWAQNLPDAG
jgi:hypothetical protein